MNFEVFPIKSSERVSPPPISNFAQQKTPAGVQISASLLKANQSICRNELVGKMGHCGGFLHAKIGVGDGGRNLIKKLKFFTVAFF